MIKKYTNLATFPSKWNSCLIRGCDPSSFEIDESKKVEEENNLAVEKNGEHLKCKNGVIILLIFNWKKVKKYIGLLISKVEGKEETALTLVKITKDKIKDKPVEIKG